MNVKTPSLFHLLRFFHVQRPKKNIFWSIFFFHFFPIYFHISPSKLWPIFDPPTSQLLTASYGAAFSSLFFFRIHWMLQGGVFHCGVWKCDEFLAISPKLMTAFSSSNCRITQGNEHSLKKSHCDILTPFCLTFLCSFFSVKLQWFIFKFSEVFFSSS